MAKSKFPLKETYSFFRNVQPDIFAGKNIGVEVDAASPSLKVPMQCLAGFHDRGRVCFFFMEVGAVSTPTGSVWGVVDDKSSAWHVG